MTALINEIVRRRSTGALSLDEWASFFQLGNFPFALNQTLNGLQEEVLGTFAGLAEGGYKGNGIIFACMLARLMLFSEARFQFQQLRSGRPGDLFGTPDLQVLEEPEPGKTTADLLGRASVDVDLAGNYFMAYRPGPAIKRMRPDWVTILLGSRTANRDVQPWSLDAEFIGLFYHPGGPGSGNQPETYTADEVAHFAPIPDPLASYRGMSWMLPIIREINGDSSATYHKLQFFNNAATPNVIVTLDPQVKLAAAREWIELFEQEHAGALNAFRTAYLGGGASAAVVGSSLKDMDFRGTQGAGEVRIASAAGVHPVIVGISEGLQGSALNSGNFTAARRLTADKTFRPLWRNFAGSIAPLINVPPGCRLWYDDRDIPFLAEDRTDASNVLAQHSTAIRTLVDGGFEPDAVVDAVTSGDLARLRNNHSGLLPVQLQAPGGPLQGPPGERQLPPGGAVQLYQRLWDAPTPKVVVEGLLRANRTFWPTSGRSAGLRIEAGDDLEAGADVVAAFPQFFDVPSAPMRGPGQIVTRQEVLSTQRQLLLEAKPAGYGSIARALNVSPVTVRRRLKETSR